LFEDGSPVELNFLRFAPPQRLERNAAGDPVLPHIRLDRAIDYLIGDWMA
jgi:predicted YcjX-like family ATPase